MNTGLRMLNKKGNATFQDAQAYIKHIDTNKDDEISK